MLYDYLEIEKQDKVLFCVLKCNLDILKISIFQKTEKRSSWFKNEFLKTIYSPIIGMFNSQKKLRGNENKWRLLRDENERKWRVNIS